MVTYKTDAFRRFLAYDDTARTFQHCTQKRTDSRGTGTDNQYRIFGRYLGNTSRPKSGSKNIAHKQSLLIAHTIRYAAQSLVSMRDPHIFRLSSVNPAS